MNKLVRYSKDKVIIDVTLDKKIRKFLQLQDELKPILSEIKEELVDIMEKTGNLNMSTSLGTKFKFKNGYTKSCIDTTALKNDNFDTYKKYLSTSIVSPTVSITLNK